MKPTKLELEIAQKRVDASFSFAVDMFTDQQCLLSPRLRGLRGEVFEALGNLLNEIEEMQMELEEDDGKDSLLGSKVLVSYKGVHQEGRVLEKVQDKYLVKLSPSGKTIYRYERLIDPMCQLF